ncbi:MAG TPA: DUF4253 domain-containing protein [Trebonia sp.]|nr:DUF4253 domain-containing protein [Trebonia sp.]
MGRQGILPADGPVEIGGVSLPAGARKYSVDDRQIVAWVTNDPVPDAGARWLSLSAARAESGLVPVLLQADPPALRAPGGEPFFGFFHRAPVALMDQMPAASVLAAAWDEKVMLSGPADDGAQAPFGRLFPGLAPAQRAATSPDALRRVAGALPPAYLGLVPAGRPADVPAAVGWSVFGSDFSGPDPLSPDFCLPGARSLKIGAVLRSWEERYGARLLRLGADAILQVLAERPPRTTADAIALAAEHYAFANEAGGVPADSVEAIAARLTNATVWTFWWA